MSQEHTTLLDIRGLRNTSPTEVLDFSKPDVITPAGACPVIEVLDHSEVRPRLASDIEVSEAQIVDCAALAPTDPELQDRRYEILRLLGKGSMADVYLARDRFLSHGRREVQVALKVFDERHPFGDQTVERIQIELLATLQINSKHVCRAHTVIELAGGRRAIVMELIRGRTLGSLIRDGLAIDYLRFAHLGIEIATGLHAAHSLDVVHRDLKPDNIMLRDTDDSAVILDFGVAKFYLDDVAITQRGNALGTPLYMAPEQFRGPVDPRTDLYALGLILARLATATVPHAGPYEEIFRERVLEPKPYRLRDRAPSAPAEYAMVVDRLLSHLPQDRFQTGADVAEALQAFIRNAEADTVLPPARPTTVRVRPKKKTPPPVPSRRRVTWIVALLLTIIATGLGALAYSLHGSSSEPINPPRASQR